MKSIWVSIQVAFSALGGFLGWYLGGVDGFLYALSAFVLVDYITGVMCAIADKKLSSAVGFKASATWWTCMCCPADIPGCPFNMARTVREMRPCCPQKAAVCSSVPQ